MDRIQVLTPREAASIFTHLWLWLHVRGLRTAVIIALFLNILNLWYGAALAPVPAQIFTDVPGVPVLGLGTWLFGLVFVGTSLPNEYWFDSGRDGSGVVVVWLGLVGVGYVLPTLASGSGEIGWVGVRNALLWSAIALCLRGLLGRVEAAVVMVFAGVTLFTLGWSSSGDPYGWALPLHTGSSVVALLITMVFLGLTVVWPLTASRRRGL